MYSNTFFYYAQPQILAKLDCNRSDGLITLQIPITISNKKFIYIIFLAEKVFNDIYTL